MRTTFVAWIVSRRNGEASDVSASAVAGVSSMESLREYGTVVARNSGSVKAPEQYVVDYCWLVSAMAIAG